MKCYMLDVVSRKMWRIYSLIEILFRFYIYNNRDTTASGFTCHGGFQTAGGNIASLITAAAKSRSLTWT